MPAETASRFPVKVRVARTDDDRRKVLAVRALVDADASHPGSRDDYDLQANAMLLLAESAIDGEVLGSLRILSSERGRLRVEDRIELPSALKRQALAEASRLVVKEGRHAKLVRLMLWKAFHRYCLAAQVDTMLIAVREPVDQDYEWIGFEDALPEQQRFEPDSSEQPTRRLMRLGVFEAQQRMSQRGHPLHDFFFVERHPEIDLLAPVGEAAARTRGMRTPKLPDHARIAAELAEMAIV